MEKNQVEQTAEPNVEVQETEQKPVENTFTQDQVTEIVKKRLAQERSQMYKKLGVDDIDNRSIDREMVTPFITNQGASVLLPDWSKINPMVQELFR